MYEYVISEDQMWSVFNEKNVYLQIDCTVYMTFDICFDKYLNREMYCGFLNVY